MPFVDAHCHLDFDQYDDDRDEVIERCGEEMTFIINSGTNAVRNEASLELARAHDVIRATMGLHPTYIKDMDADAVGEIAAQIREHRAEIIAVGEIGLDYHHIREDEWRERQEDWCEALLKLAAELDMPAVLHTRDAEPRAMELLSGYDADLPGVMLHCFNGRPALAEEAVDRGYHVSISTQVLYSSRVQALAETVPLDHMLLETDSPFLYQGERNAPWHVKESAETIADITGCDVEAVGTTTTENARDLFGM